MIEQCDRHFQALHEKLDRMDEAIRGNGKPGITLRLDRLEQAAARQARLINLIMGAMATALSSAIVIWLTR